MRRRIERAYKPVLDYRVPITALVVSAYLATYALSGNRPLSLVDPQWPLGMWGTALALAGMALRSWAAGGLFKGRVLATSGPYALTRHPLYAGTFLTGAGLAMVMADPWFLLVLVLLGVLVMGPKIMQEERINAERFGEEWEAFRGNTALFFPKRLPLDLRAPWTGAQWLHNREYRASGATVLALGLLQELHQYLAE